MLVAFQFCNPGFERDYDLRIRSLDQAFELTVLLLVQFLDLTLERCLRLSGLIRPLIRCVFQHGCCHVEHRL